MSFNPFVPKEGVISVAINCNYTKLLKNSNIEILPIKGAEILPQYIRNHADINIFNAKNKLFLAQTAQISENNYITDKKETEIIKLGEVYTKYNKLNAFVLSNTIFGRLSVLDKRLVDCYEKKVDVKQSYAKCSTAIITDNAAITDDISVYNAIVKAGLDALIISKGDIILETKEHGFIGGATGFISKDILAFAGNYKTHRDYIAMKEFARNHNCYFESLCNGRLHDIGGILPIL